MKSIKISTRILGTFGVLVLLLVVVVAMASRISVVTDW